MTTRNRINNVLTLTAVIAATLAFAGTADAELINVNFNGFTGGNPGPTQVEGSLEGPAGGLGTSWNQYADEDSTGVMVDSAGAATGVTFTTNFSEGRYDGTGPALTMNRATLTDFGRGLSRTVNIFGLNPGGLYDVWLVSHRHQNGAQPNLRERQVGTWTAVNPTSSLTSQLVDGRLSGASPQGDVFQDGVNYALFENVVADGGGSIVFQGQGATIAVGFPDDYRLHLSGFQIADVVASAIPEPSTFTMTALGLLTLGLVGWRRRRR